MLFLINKLLLLYFLYYLLNQIQFVAKQMRKNSYMSTNEASLLDQDRLQRIRDLINKFSQGPQTKLKQCNQQIIQIFQEDRQLISNEFQTILNDYKRINSMQLKIFLFFSNVYLNVSKNEQNRAMSIINEIISKAEDNLIAKDINEIITFIIGLCYNKKFFNINFKIEDESILKQRVMKIKTADIKNNNIINMIVLSPLYTTLTQICTQKNVYFFLLLTSIVTRIDIVNEEYFEKNMENIVKLLERKPITQNQFEILLKIITGSDISQIMQNIDKKDEEINLKFQQLLFITLKKILKQKQLKDRDRIFRMLNFHMKPNFFEKNPQFFEVAVNATHREENVIIDQILHQYISFEIQNQMTYKKIKTIFKNLKVHSHRKDNVTQDYRKLQKNYKFIEMLNCKNNNSYTILDFYSKKSAVIFQNLNIRAPFTIFLYAKIKSNFNEFCYLITLVSKKLTIQLSIKQSLLKKNHFSIRCIILETRKCQQFQISLQNSEGLIALATHQQGLLITISNYCYLIPVFNLQLKTIILGNSLLTADNKRITEKTSIKQIKFFYISQQFYQVTSLMADCKQKCSIGKKLKKLVQQEKMLLYFEQSGLWNINSNKSTIRKLLQNTQNINEIQCFRTEKHSFKKILIKSGNIDIFFILIQYYSRKLKQNDSISMIDKILSLLISFVQQDEQNIVFKWLDQSINKLSFVLWILSSILKQKKQIIQKVFKLIFLFRETENLKYHIIRQFQYKFIRNILFKSQIWRNYSFQDQLIIYQVLDTKLIKEKFFKEAIENADLQKILFSISVYYKLDQTIQNGIKRKLSKQELLSIHLLLKQLYLRGIFQDLKQKKSELNLKIMLTWWNNIKNIFYVVIISNQQEINEQSNDHFSKQYFFELIQMIREIITFLSAMQYRNLFKQLLIKQKGVRIDHLLFCLIEKQIDYTKKYKKTLIYNFSENLKISDLQILHILENLFLQVLILKQESIDYIIFLFEKLKRRQADFGCYFKILLKVYKDNLGCEDKIYTHIINKVKSQNNYNSSTTFISLKQQLHNFIKKCESRDFIDALNNNHFLQIFQMIIAYQNSEKDIVKLILIKYLGLDRIQPIHINYWMHINSLKQYPHFQKKSIKILNLYRIQTGMIKQSYIRMVYQNYNQICAMESETKEQSQFCLDIIGFILVKIQDINIKQLMMLANIYNKKNFIKNSVKNIILDFVPDILFLKSLEILNKTYFNMIYEYEQRDSEDQTQKQLLQSIIELYRPSILQNIEKYIATLKQEDKNNVKQIFQNINTFNALLNRKDIITQIFIPNIRKYAFQPLCNFFLSNKFNEKLAISKRINKPKCSYNLNNSKNIKKIDFDEFRESYYDYLDQSIKTLLKYFKNYEDECRQIEQEWSTIKKTNNFWIYFMARQQKFYKIDSVENKFRSKINVKTSILTKDNTLSKFPRRKSNIVNRFKNSFDNSSSIHLSQPDCDIVNTQSMIVMIEQRSRKDSGSKIQQNQNTMQDRIKFDCEYIKVKGTYSGHLFYLQQSKQGKIIFLANTDEQLMRQKNIITDKYVKYSTCQDLKLYEQKKKQISLNGATVYTRRYILRHTAVQIFVNGKSYFFNFFTQRARDKFLDKIKNKAQCIINRKQEFKKRTFTQQWRLGKISNFQYLMILNTYSGRTYQDISQYPIFPWVVKNFQAEKIDKHFLENINNFRDLELPMGKLNNERFIEYKNRQQQIIRQNPKEDYLYGSFYSNPMSIIHYMIRLEPFTSLHWKHQSKKFDHADRLFSNFEQQFISSTTQTSDLKELIPQFYCFSQFLKNKNQFFFGLKQNKIEVNQVYLPKWANSPQQFIFKMRQILESDYVSKNLNKWIDLIFGFKSSKSNAKKYDNLFHFRTYQHDIFEEYPNEDEEDQIKVAQAFISQFGQVPECLFEQKHVEKIIFQNQSIDTMIKISNYNQANRLCLGPQGLMVITSSSIHLISSFSNFFQDKISNIEIKLHPKTINIDLIQTNEWSWLQFTKNQIYLCNLKGKQQYFYYHQPVYATVINSSVVIAQQFNLSVYSLKKTKLKMLDLRGHHDKVYIIQYCKYSDIIVSVDRDDYVALNYKKSKHKNKKFIRHWNLELNMKQQIKLIRIHPLGLILFFTNQDVLNVFTFLGQKLFTTAFKFYNNQQITQIHFYSPDKSTILVSTNSGQLFAIDLFQIQIYRKNNPDKRYFKVGKNYQNILANIVFYKGEKRKVRNVSSQKSQKILDFYIDWSNKPYYKIYILYQSGDLCCVLNKNENNLKD